MSYWQHDGLEFRYREEGAGTPFFFQHGLGGDVNQPLGLFRPPPGFRALSLDCRGHGLTRPLGPEGKLGIGASADDVLALMDHLGIESAIVGGISMGAAIALNLTLRYPARVRGLVLARAAWLDGPMQRNAEIFAHIARLIRQHGAAEGERLFSQTDDYRQMLAQSTDCAAALLGQFMHPRAEETVAKLERIPRDQPCQDLRDVQSIGVPTLVLANQQDPIHPFEYGRRLAELIPGAVFRELTPKSVSVPKYEAEMQDALTEFLARNFAPGG
jgi:pimeloyl-ACP methyl ester carboxylesterase